MILHEEKINARMITLAREARGLSQAELIDKINVSQATLSKMEKEEVPVHEDMLKKISEALNFPKKFFYQEGEILPPNMSYRKRNKVAQKIITPIEANVNIYRLNILKLLKAINFSQANFPIIDLAKGITPEEAARTVRRFWNVPNGAIENVTDLLEENKIIVMSFDFDTERVDGRGVLALEKNPVIFVNKNQLADRQRFTLAYELGHIVMHLFTSPSFDRDVSHEANLFAAEFLMPEAEIRNDLKETVTMAKLAEMKRKWQQSMIALLFRGNTLQLITDNQKRYLISQFNSLKIRRREPPELDVQREVPKLLRDLITNYKSKQRLTVQGMAEFLNLQHQDFLKRYS